MPRKKSVRKKNASRIAQKSFWGSRKHILGFAKKYNTSAIGPKRVGLSTHRKNVAGSKWSEVMPSDWPSQPATFCPTTSTAGLRLPEANEDQRQT